MENNFINAKEFISKQNKKFRIMKAYIDMLIPLVRQQEQNIINDIQDDALNDKVAFFEKRINKLQPGFLRYKADFIIRKAMTNNLPRFTQ